MGLAGPDQRFQVIAGAVGVTRDETLENQRALAGEDGVNSIPVGRIEFAQLELFQNRTRVAQFYGCYLKDFLRFRLGLRPFLEAHDRQPRFFERRYTLVGIDLKAGKGPAMRIAVA